jgi:transcriptional regulator with PAS, ATPase and Fis domain
VLTDTLLESELFGYMKGAFTGAVTDKPGTFELADRGTLFLDEIGEMAPALQTKLLRVLQVQEFFRLGGTRPIKVDVRLIAATNRDLEKAVKEGAFRQDLYYRLKVVDLTLPPLRQRRDDVLHLANHFVDKYSKKCNRKVAGISPEARAYLMSYDWPGNIRELENAIERAIVLGSSDIILPEDLPENILDTAPPEAPSSTYQNSTREAKKQIVLKALEDAGWNINEAAKHLGIHPNNLYRLMRNLGIKRK